VFSTKTVKHTQIHMPTLLLWGADDPAFSVDLAELSLNYMDDGRVKYIDGAAHFGNLDQPDKVNEYMKVFLSD